MAAWTKKHLVNRSDVFGHYRDVDAKSDPRGATITDKSPLTAAVLTKHYQGRARCDLIGLHSTERTADGQCDSRWLGVDVDHHDDKGDPEANRRAAISLYQRGAELGFHPLLLDSNGNGGYHLLILFSTPTPTRDVFRFGKWLTRDWKELGLREKPETFPKQEAIEAGRFGNWLRLPGKHHTRDHVTRVWDGTQWLDGAKAAEAILKTRGTSPTAIPSEALEEAKPKTPKRLLRSKAAHQLAGDAELARQALRHLGDMADDYDQWVMIGMSLRSLGPDGLALWDEWSRRSPKYQDGDCERKWPSFKPGAGRNLGSLFHDAKSRGWPGPGRNGSAQGDGAAKKANTANDGSKGPPPEDGEGDRPADPRPVIRITTQEYAVADQAVSALARDPDVFQRVNLLVTILRDVPRKNRIIRPPGSPRIASLPMPRIRELVTKHARWEKYSTKKKDTWEPAHPPDWVVKAMTCRGHWPEIRPLEAVAETPVLRPDGTVLERPGYDERTGILYEPNADFPKVPRNPTIDDARRAAGLLLGLVVDFPFAGDADRMAWLASVLTPMARFAIIGPCPLFLIDSNAPATGKSKLTDIAAIISTGRDMPRTAYPNNDDEMRKRIGAIAMAADRLMLLDNIASTFGGSSLDAALTATSWRDRILGRSEMTPELPLFTVWYATGNNVALRGDAIRRVVPIRLETLEERPEERQTFTIKGDLLDHVKQARPALVSAALTILRAHAVAGRPNGGLPPLGSYEAWCQVIRFAIHWVTGIDPCETRKALRASDPEALARIALIEGWTDLPDGRKGISAAAALKAVREDPSRYEKLHTALMEWSRTEDLPKALSIGMRLKAIKGRNINGMHFASEDDGRGTLLWRVEHVPR